MGPAWYQRDIEFPADWKGKCIFLYFERTHWLSSVWVDTKEVSRLDYISVPHNHDLTDFVTPGKTHRITVCIDNRFQYNTHKWNHAHTEFTQINWNGILGEMKLVAVDPVYIDDMQLYPDLATNSVDVRLKIDNRTKKPFEGKALLTVSGNGLHVTKEVPVGGEAEEIDLTETVALGREAKLWDEFNPNLYTVECTLLTGAGKESFEHKKSATFGMREVAQGRNHILLNGRPLHLRGTVENAVFPKTGHAPVGVLDPFWDSKGLVTPEDWRAFCAPTVALLRYPKSAWFEDETFTAKAEVYNFGAAALKNAKIRWSITDGSGKAIAKGSLKSQTVGTDGVFPVGEFSAPLGKVRGPQKLTVHLNVGEKTSNSWDIWVYPRNAQLMQSDTEVLYTTEFGEQAKQYLAAGKKVVLTPAPNKVKGRKSTFHNHFWNPIMFAWAPMTIGCLIHAEEPVFADFPTSYHTDWQWWDILENAKVIEMQQTPRQLRPFIQVIDSFDNNEKLGIGFEARVGGGKLLVLAVDTKKKMDQRPATRQLLESIDRYVRSDRFAPEVTLDESFITSFMR